MSPEASKIVEIVQERATQNNAFAAVGPGAGNKTTHLTMQQANREVAKLFGSSVIEKAFILGVKQNVDFYIERTREVIEVEFSLRNPYPCLEKDSMKILLAKDAGFHIDRLILVGDPGCTKRLATAATQRIIDYLRRVHALEVEIHELQQI